MLLPFQLTEITPYVFHSFPMEQSILKVGETSVGVTQ